MIVVLLFAGYGLGVFVGRYGGVVDGGVTVASASLVPAVRRSGGKWTSELRLLFLAGALVGVVSIATGLGNNATDEPFTMWGYLSLLLHGRDPYTTVATITFAAPALGLTSRASTGQFHYIYLPLLLFLQVPGTGATGYKAICLGCWAGIVYLVRRDEVASLCLASPMVALLASNGFTDLPVLFLMTFSLRTARGIPGKAVEYATYAMKQFANLFWLVRYVARRDARRAVGVLAVTLLLCAPFLLWHPTGIWCEALTFGLSPGCAGAPNTSGDLSDLYLHWNYYLWVLWVYALYEVEIRDLLRGWWGRFRLAGRHPARGTRPETTTEGPGRDHRAGSEVGDALVRLYRLLGSRARSER